MLIETYQYEAGHWNSITKSIGKLDGANLVICFAAKNQLIKNDVYDSLKHKFPRAHIAICSTAGEIFSDSVTDNEIIALVIQMERTTIRTATANIKNFSNSFDLGQTILTQIPLNDLAYVFVLSDGSLVNGSELVRGMNKTTQGKVLITGGLAGDGANFKSTLVGLDERPSEGNVLAIGFYGKNIVIGHGTQGGWDTFGRERTVTKAYKNKLYELDGKCAIELYKKYLGQDVDRLPSSALLFPLSVTIPGNDHPVVRTILSIDEDEHAMIFAGDIPEGSIVRMMHANFDRLTSAAGNAAQYTLDIENVNRKPDLSILISCVGRKLILGHRIDEEVETVREILGDDTIIAGFYSYGEISPLATNVKCELHNQTMTITSFYEI